MDRKTLTIILALALLAGFFLPWFGKASGLDYVTAKGAGWKEYLLLLIPISGLLLLLGSFNGTYALSRGLLCIIPFLVVLFMLIISPLIDGVQFKYIFKALGKGYGLGLWVTIVGSLVLAFYNPPGRD